MTLKVNKSDAFIVLEAEVNNARSIDLSGDSWVKELKTFFELCEESGQANTMVAILGTAILAKSTNIDIDPLSIKARDNSSERAYSARGLCTSVLAENADKFGIDLGITGGEPHNNGVFNKAARITEDLEVKSKAQPVLLELIRILKKLDSLKTEKSIRNVLRAFLYIRKKKISPKVAEEAKVDLYTRDLVKIINQFVEENLENGKRAQAVAAGILDTLFGKGRVETQKINDPSRNTPGDVTVYESSSKKVIHSSYEVRSKNVSEKDVHTFITKVRESGFRRAGVIAVAVNQSKINEIQELYKWAETRDVDLSIFIGWEDLVRSALFFSNLSNGTPEKAYLNIFNRLKDLHVSESGRKLLLELAGIEPT